MASPGAAAAVNGGTGDAARYVPCRVKDSTVDPNTSRDPIVQDEPGRRERPQPRPSRGHGLKPGRTRRAAGLAIESP